LHRQELDNILDDEVRHRRLVELNVIEQCLNLFKTGVVQQRRVATYQENMATGYADYSTPRIHACVFDPRVGDLIRLRVDFRSAIADLGGIYNLYHLPDRAGGIANESTWKDSKTESRERTNNPSHLSTPVRNRFVGGNSYLDAIN
jgi:hypothetical protein